MDNIIFDRIRSEITANDVVLFMKGTAVFPQCGFSAAAAQILTQLNIAFKDINVLEDSGIRQGIKDFAHTFRGHGGLLDRFDSLMLVLPAIFHYVHYIRGVAQGQTPRILTHAWF